LIGVELYGRTFESHKLLEHLTPKDSIIPSIPDEFPVEDLLMQHTENDERSHDTPLIEHLNNAKKVVLEMRNTAAEALGVIGMS
jgi:hypothetical protein